VIRFFRHYIPISILALVILEGLILIGALYLGVSVRFDEGVPKSVGSLFPRALTFTVVMLALMTALGMYDWEWRSGLRSLLLRMGLAFGLGFVLMSLLFYLFPESLYLGRGVFLLALGIGMASVLFIRLGFWQWLSMDALKTRVLVLGSGSRAAKIDELLTKQGTSSGLQVVGYVPLASIHHFVPHEQILDATEPLSSLADRLQVDEIILAVRDRRGGALPVADLLDCKLKGIRVLELSSFFERENGHLQLDSLNASWMILGDGFHQGMLRDTIKRMFDVVASLILLSVTLPFMILAALAIKFESTGPVFYRQERVGQHGRPFTIFKFRSMRADAEQDGKPRWAQANDDRTTRVGRFIRKTRIDELPQIFNVFMGDMSFVGPRPERPYFVAELNQQIPYYGVRHTIKPGITGWAQVRHEYGASVEDAIEKLQYDLYYVKNHSLFLDLMILFQTVQVVLWGKGAR
jgi:sugar transferase (PEP-CTERM system associated)